MMHKLKRLKVLILMIGLVSILLVITITLGWYFESESYSKQSLTDRRKISQTVTHQDSILEVKIIKLDTNFQMINKRTPILTSFSSKIEENLDTITKIPKPKYKSEKLHRTNEEYVDEWIIIHSAEIEVEEKF